ncbi:Hairy/enhancer-of-split with YRPW motif protein 2 [Rhizoctonia solani]
MSLNLAPSYPHPPWDFKDKDSFAYATVVKRWPVIITNIIDTVYRAVDAEGNSSPEKVAEGKALISQLSKLKYDMSHDRPLAEIPEDGGLNSKVYNDRLQDLEKSGNNTWMKIPWLFGECYLYRLFDSIFRATKHWSKFDPFFQQKEDTFRESGAAVHRGINGLWPLFHVFNRLEELAQVMVDIEGRRKEFEQGGDGWEDKLAIVFAEMVQMCLWGNATDLSMLPSMDPADVALLQAVGEDKAHLILRNDAGALWNHVRSLRDARLDFVLDNAGFELFTDLVFADFLITFTPYASKAVFHPKPIPWFVSDVTPRDWDAIFRALKDPDFFTMLDPSMAHPNALKKMVERWEAYTQTGLFALAPEETYAFWAAPGGYWEVAPGMDGEVVGKILDGSGLVIFKGDLK